MKVRTKAHKSSPANILPLNQPNLVDATSFTAQKQAQLSWSLCRLTCPRLVQPFSSFLPSFLPLLGLSLWLFSARYSLLLLASVQYELEKSGVCYYVVYWILFKTLTRVDNKPAVGNKMEVLLMLQLASCYFQFTNLMLNLEGTQSNCAIQPTNCPFFSLPAIIVWCGEKERSKK